MKKVILFVVCMGFAVSGFAESIFDYGFYLRLRQEYLKNVFDYNSRDVLPDDNYFRLKTSVWGKWNFNEDISLFAKLTSEPKLAVDSDGQIAGGENVWDDEIFVDNLYLDVKGFLGSPVDLRLGRQDFLMTHGEGFVIMDGTPFDGSRSFYFNAAKATWNFDENNSLDVIYTFNREEEDFLPVINDQDRRIIAMDERALILYGKFMANECLSLQPYYIHKTEDAHVRQGQDVAQLKLNTIGNRAVYNFAPWRLRGELAYQFGEYSDNRDRDGLGGYVFLTRSFKDARFSPSLDVGYAYLSGESNPYVDKDRGWNPVFSKWPWISELYVFSPAIERGEPGYWSNVQVWRAKVDMKMAEQTGLSLSYNYLRANENPEIDPLNLFGTGKERGHLPQVLLTHRFNRNLDAHFLFEYFRPGNFYADDKDDAFFVRWQLQARF